METDRQKEAERLYCRLMSSDPDFNDCTDAANFIRAAAIDLKGPDGFESWQDAAVSERIRRVKAEAELAELRRTQPEATAPAPIPGLPFADLATPIKEFEARKAAALASSANARFDGSISKLGAPEAFVPSTANALSAGDSEDAQFLSWVKSHRKSWLVEFRRRAPESYRAAILQSQKGGSDGKS